MYLCRSGLQQGRREGGKEGEREDGERKGKQGNRISTEKPILAMQWLSALRFTKIFTK